MNNRLICGDVLDVLPTLGRFKCLVADPPDNLGLKYDVCDDKLNDREYKNLLRRWIWQFKCTAGISWTSFNAKWIFTVGRIVEDLLWCCPDYEAKLFIQPFTFGQNRDSDCGNGYRPLLRIMHKDAKRYPEAIKVPSWRQLNGDKRAREGGKVPLDVWDFTRVVGNSKQRRAWHPTQLNEELIERIIKFSTVPGDTICDCFSGTGTVLRALCNLTVPTKIPDVMGGYIYQSPRNPVTSIELSRNYCLHIAAEHGLKIEEFERDESRRKTKVVA